MGAGGAFAVTNCSSLYGVLSYTCFVHARRFVFNCVRSTISTLPLCRLFTDPRPSGPGVSGLPGP